MFAVTLGKDFGVLFLAEAGVRYGSQLPFVTGIWRFSQSAGFVVSGHKGAVGSRRSTQILPPAAALAAARHNGPSPLPLQVRPWWPRGVLYQTHELLAPKAA
jgi:hypothetical protein